MSFALTTTQIEQQEKDVTRRLGWEFLKVGELLRPVKKCMGLRPGEKIQQVGHSIIRVVDVRREALEAMTEDLSYGFEEVRREGFANHPTLRWPNEWVEFFCSSHKGCQSETIITRIEFEYV